MALSQRYRLLAPVALLGAAALMLAGCAEGGTGNGGGGEAKKTVRISGGITGGEQTPSTSPSISSPRHRHQGRVRRRQVVRGQHRHQVTGGDAPDIAVVPQPGLLKTLVDTGKVLKAPEDVETAVDANWSPDWKKYGTFDDTFYAAPMLANLKGYVWYSPKQFAEWGVEAPKTWDEMIALTDKIVETTGKPAWCAGFSSEAASGWPGTDWVEDLVLRQSGADVYDKWVAGDVKFTDPEIKKAFDAVGDILLNQDYVNAGYGDVKSINSTAFGDVAAAVASGDCALTHQASFLSANFLDVKTKDGNTPEVAPDGDVYAFIMPGYTEGELQIEGGGEFVAGFSDDESTQKVLAFMASPEFADARVKLGGVISANKKADPASPRASS